MQSREGVMKNIRVFLVVLLCVLPFAVNAQDPDAGVIKTAEENIFSWSSVVIGADVLLAFFAVSSYSSFLNGNKTYEDKYALIDNTTMGNYTELVNMREDVIGSQNIAYVAAGAAGAALLYTVLDIFWLHAAFVPEVKVTAVNGGAMLACSVKF